MEKAAAYFPSTKVAIRLQDKAPKSPDRIRYDLRRYPNSGTESLERENLLLTRVMRTNMERPGKDRHLINPYKGLISHGNDENPDITAV